MTLVDAVGDHALIVEHPDPEKVAEAQRTGRWRETIGAFQLGIPVSDKAAMLGFHIRILSVLRWRLEWLRPNNPWYETLKRYVELIAEKVRALGGDPHAVPATPDGNVQLPGKDEVKDEDHDEDKDDEREGCIACLLRIFTGRRHRKY